MAQILGSTPVELSEVVAFVAGETGISDRNLERQFDLQREEYLSNVGSQENQYFEGEFPDVLYVLTIHKELGASGLLSDRLGVVSIIVGDGDEFLGYQLSQAHRGL